jgi:hypothetical protein
MSQKRHFLRDRFTFSLRGMTATASWFITPVLADDRINRAWDEKLDRRTHQSGASEAPLGPLCSRPAG